MRTSELPQTQHAVQLVGPGELKYNPQKDVLMPGPHQILVRVEAVGLCFSDLKLLKQFSNHVRKGEVLHGLDGQVLKQIPSYVPGDRPTVPGHEVVCRIVAVGEKVQHHRLGERCLVQTDYRELHTSESNAAFGYNFEGGLQEYVLMDERVVVDRNGERFLIPVDETLSASAVALVEPWACVEDSYVNSERRHIKPGGRLAVIVDEGHEARGLEEAWASGKPSTLVAVLASPRGEGGPFECGIPSEPAGSVADLREEYFDDVVYFGARAPTIAELGSKLAPHGIINIVTAGRSVGAPVSVGIGRVHYGMTRWIGTYSADASESYTRIPENGEIRPGERIAVVGAAGPMGQMHVIRNICLGVPGLSLTATDIDDARLAMLLRKASPHAQARGVEIKAINTSREPLTGEFSYFALLVPSGKLVADAIARSAVGCLINVFAGIPASVRQDLDLDRYIASRCYMFGTSGSVVGDMRIVLDKVLSGSLNTNVSVDAVSGMAGAVAGIAAVENRALAGKIIVYPELHDLGLLPLEALKGRFPTVSERLNEGQWTKDAEAELLRVGVTGSEAKGSR